MLLLEGPGQGSQLTKVECQSPQSMAKVGSTGNDRIVLMAPHYECLFMQAIATNVDFRCRCRQVCGDVGMGTRTGARAVADLSTLGER